VDSRTKQAFVAPSTLPVTDKPVTLSLSKGLAKGILAALFQDGMSEDPAATSLRPLAPGISMDDDTSTTGLLDEEGNEEESNKCTFLGPILLSPPNLSKLLP
jgi:hypothetical protein